MAINFNTNPYYDDFDETKGYHRILFRPGYAVQARELTQLQTQLQDQINKFGKHIFVNGSIVLGGGRTFEKDLTSIKVETNFGGQSVNINQFRDKIIVGQTSGAQARVKQATGLTATDPITFIVKPVAGDAFQAGEVVQTEDGAYSATIQNIISNPINNAMLFSVDEGIFFVDSNFVFAEAQTIPVDKYSNTSSKNIGFIVTESIIDSDADDQLLDRAQGSPNFAAPGADRFKIELTLTSKDLNTDQDNFIEIARVVDGELVVNKSKTVYSEIGNELARRTFDESGDYTVKKFPIQVLDHQADTPDPTKFTVALDPGKAYIKGYEFETINQEFLTLDRARREAINPGDISDIGIANAANVSTAYGNYVVVDSLVAAPNDTAPIFNQIPNNYTSISLRNSGNTTIGSAKLRYIKYAGLESSSPFNPKWNLYLFDIEMSSGSFADVESIAAASGAMTATINADSKVNGTGDTYISGADSPGLVFKMSNDYIKTLLDNGTPSANYVTQKTYNLSFSAGTFTLSPGTGEALVGSGVLSDTEKLANYLIFNPTTGAVLDFRDSNSGSIEINAQGQATFTYGAAPTLSGNIILVATVLQNNVLPRTKALEPYTIKILGNGSNGLNTVQGVTESLGISDVYDVTIYNNGTTNPTGVTVNASGVVTGLVGNPEDRDVTSDYIFDNGQRAEYYDHGGITLSGTAPAANEYLVVVYRNFVHSGNGYLSVDSYAEELYDSIPVFTDPATGEQTELRDAIDFRPIRTNNGTSFTGGLVPDPESSSGFESDYEYYLGRIDKIIATSNLEFVVKQGTPAIYPKAPTDLSNGMSLYAVVIPPYTKSVSDIQIKYIDNQRYTMKDIGKLEKRINNLEYYTQLSLLEKQAKDTAIPDSSNQEKFKNGFAVDPFTSADIFAVGGAAWSQRRWGWWNAWFNGSNNWNQAALNYNNNSIAQPADADFNAAIDPINQELRAPFTTEFHYFNTGTLTDTEKHSDSITLEYTETDAITQNLATTFINVNPFNVIRFAGFINLEPSFDQWVDTNQLPAVNQIVDVQLPDAADLIINRFTGSGNAVRVTSTSASVQQNVLSSQTSSLGNNVVDIQFIPFIRNNQVLAIGNSFKPLSRLYGYMENTSIDSNLTPLTVIEVRHESGDLFDDTKGIYEGLTIRSGSVTGSIIGTAETAIYSDITSATAGQLPSLQRRLLTVFNETTSITIGDFIIGANGGVAEVTAVTTYNAGDAIVPDEYGNIGVLFDIPAETFRTGERTFRLINSSTNDVEAQDSIGEAKYTAVGLLQDKQENILTTRAIQNQRVIERRGRRFWADPVAQSFLIDANAYPQGMHISSIDVFFRSKSNTVPITMEIRRTVNGYPEAQTTTIPFAVAVKKPQDVVADPNGDLPTKFEFPAVHLTPGEYAITLIANTQEYEVFIAEMGETSLDGTVKVDKQPYAGSLFKSQNASTWEADQNKDLKFVIRRASFALFGTAEFEIQDPATVKDYHAIFANANAATPDGTDITWYAAAYTNSGTYDPEFALIDINQDIEYTRLLQLAAAANAGGGPTLRLRARLTSNSGIVSPMIDAKSLAVIVTENTINKPNVLTEAGISSGGNALAKYITKPINLADGFDASNINVTVDINKPGSTDVKVYYRTLPSGEVTPITDENWVEMRLENVVPSSINNFDFKEHRFFPPNAFGNFGIPNDNPISTRFNTFQIKIVMLSDQKQFSPKLRDLRIIALDS